MGTLSYDCEKCEGVHDRKQHQDAGVGAMKTGGMHKGVPTMTEAGASVGVDPVKK